MPNCDSKIPWGIAITRVFCPVTREKQIAAYRIFILILTFLSYTSYHLSRKPISVVKPQLLNCTKTPDGEPDPNGNCTSFITQMNGVTEEEAKRLEGTLDSVYLFSYAFFMFFSGIVAERVNLRYFLAIGSIFSGIFTFLFGAAKYWEIKSIYYFIVVQFLGGACQTTGWPGVVTVVANWFGKAKKGLIFGIWNSHTSIGNILGSVIAGAFVNDDWGLSFIVPGLIIASVGMLLWLFLVPHPSDVGLDVMESSSSSNQQDSNSHIIANGESRYNERSVLRNQVMNPGESTPLLQSDEDEVSPPNTPQTVPKNGRINRGYQSNESLNNEGSDLETGETEQEESREEEQAISFWGALKIPGVIEFSLCLFFAKLVSYTFLYWLPTFIKENGENISTENAAYLSTLFDIGGILGGMFAGLLSDYTGRSASTCAIMLIFAIPMLFAYASFGEHCPLDMKVKDHCYTGTFGLLLSLGFLVNGPYALITTAVSAELGKHPSLGNSAKALATVTSIIDGTGSIGAAVGPFLAGSIPGTDKIFYMLMASDLFALVLLTRLVKNEITSFFRSRRQNRMNNLYQNNS